MVFSTIVGPIFRNVSVLCLAAIFIAKTNYRGMTTSTGLDVVIPRMGVGATWAGLITSIAPFAEHQLLQNTYRMECILVGLPNLCLMVYKEAQVNTTRTNPFFCGAHNQSLLFVAL